MHKRIFRILVEVEHLNRAVFPHRLEAVQLMYETGKPVPPIPGESDDPLHCVLIEYDEQADEDGDLVGVYNVYAIPPEGSPLHDMGLGIVITHSTSEVRRVYDAMLLTEMKAKIDAFNAEMTEEENNEQGGDDDEGAGSTQAAGPTPAGTPAGQPSV